MARMSHRDYYWPRAVIGQTRIDAIPHYEMIRITPKTIRAMAMAHMPNLMIALALPRPARDDEADDDQFDNQGTEELLSCIYNQLREGDEVTAHATLGLAQALERMVHAAMKGDKQGLDKWNEHVCELAGHIQGGGSDYEEND